MVLQRGPRPERSLGRHRLPSGESPVRVSSVNLADAELVVDFAVTVAAGSELDQSLPRLAVLLGRDFLLRLIESRPKLPRRPCISPNQTAAASATMTTMDASQSLFFIVVNGQRPD